MKLKIINKKKDHCCTTMRPCYFRMFWVAVFCSVILSGYFSLLGIWGCDTYESGTFGIFQQAYGQVEKLVSLNFKNTDLVDVFRLLAEQSELNIVVSSNVKGKVSMRLSDITVGEAIQVLLDAGNLVQKREGNIIKIFQAGDIEKPKEEVQETVTEIIKPNFVKASELQTPIQKLLSKQGKIEIFSGGANKNLGIFIIDDIPQNLEKIKYMIEKLDTPTPQVLIESKIIETSLAKNESLGINWSIASELNGPPFSIDSKYASGGKITYGTLNITQFRGVMQMLETRGDLNILSDAKLTTMDGESANIMVGDQIYLANIAITAGSGGATPIGTTSYTTQNVGVELTVTPQVYNNKYIVVDVSPTIKTVKEFAQVGGGGVVPTLQTREANTKIMIKDGDTIVIGGLIQDYESVSGNSIPILGNLPLLGPLFRNKNITKRKTDLLIFITAHIVNIEPLERQSEISNTSSPEKISPDLEQFLEYK